MAPAVWRARGGGAGELAKSLSTDDQPGFGNGVLGQIVQVTPQIRAAAAARRSAP